MQSPTDILNKNTVFNQKTRKRVLEIKEYKCELCGITCWNEKPIVLEVHHIDGDRTNNFINNLLLLCPNCHALTDNYGNKKLHS